MNYTDEELFNLSDEDLEKAFAEAKAQDTSPESDFEEDVKDDNSFNDDEEVEVEEDEEVDDLEQPDEDSDDDTSSETDEEDESEEDSEADEDNLDGDSEEDEETLDDEEDESDDDEQPVQKRKYRANGQEYEFSDDEIFEKFGQIFGQAANYTQKMQAIKPWRKTIDAIEQAKLTHEDINLAIDVLKGDKNAIAELIKRTGTDALDLDTENTNYVPKDYGRNDTELDIKDIVNEIKSDKEYATTYNILEEQWDSNSREEFIKKPELIRQLHIDVKTGMYDTIAPLAKKLKVYDGGSQSDLDYYKQAARQYFDNQAQEEARLEAQRVASAKREDEQAERNRIEKVKAQSAKRVATKKASTKRKAAAPTKNKSTSTKVVDYLDASDDSFEEWYKNLQDSL